MKANVRALAAVIVSVGLFLGGSVVLATPSSAHPLGNFTVNRYSGIEISPGRIQIHYVLDMAEIPTFQERSAIDANGDGVETGAERRAYANAESSALLSRVTLTADGVAIPLSVVGEALRYLPGQAGLPTLRLEATFAGPIPSSGAVQYRDGNFAGRVGWKEITVTSERDVAITSSSAPATSTSRELLVYPKDLLSSPLDVTSARFTFRPGHSFAVASDEPAGPTVSSVPIAGGGAFAGLVGWRLTPFLVALSVVLAFLFGALHALGPGHGKTITAAYLVGAGARSGQAVVVGVSVALMHTASVLTLGVVLLVLARSVRAEYVYPWLTTGMGLVALGLGAGLFISRLRTGRAARSDPGDHAPGPGGHVHRRSGHGLAALAVAGGILPSPTAFVVLAGSIGAHRLGYGLLLISAFSLGLAGSLVLVGLVALRVRALVAPRLGGRLAAMVQLLSAAVIIAFGMFFSVRGAAQLL